MVKRPSAQSRIIHFDELIRSEAELEQAAPPAPNAISNAIKEGKGGNDDAAPWRAAH